MGQGGDCADKGWRVCGGVLRCKWHFLPDTPFYRAKFSCREEVRFSGHVDQVGAFRWCCAPRRYMESTIKTYTMLVAFGVLQRAGGFDRAGCDSVITTNIFCQWLTSSYQNQIMKRDCWFFGDLGHRLRMNPELDP